MTNFSVVIPTCDRPDKLLTAVQSIIKQSYQPYEIIIVDNGRKPISLSNIQCRTIITHLPPRSGVSRARNKGADVACGEYIAFLDDDDTWAVDYLERMHQEIESHIVQPDLLIGRKDILINGQQKIYKCVKHVDELMPDLLHRNPGVGGPLTVVKRDTFLALGGFDESLVTSEDRALVLDFIKNNKEIVCVPNAVAIIDRGDGDHLTNKKTLLIGKKQFLKKYKYLMGYKDYFRARAKIFFLEHKNNVVINAFLRLFKKASKSPNVET